MCSLCWFCTLHRQIFPRVIRFSIYTRSQTLFQKKRRLLQIIVVDSAITISKENICRCRTGSNDQCFQGLKSKDLVKVLWVLMSLFPMTAMDSALVLVVPVDDEVDGYSQQPAVHKAFGCRICVGAPAGK